MKVEILHKSNLINLIYTSTRHILSKYQTQIQVFRHYQRLSLKTSYKLKKSLRRIINETLTFMTALIAVKLGFDTLVMIKFIQLTTILQMCGNIMHLPNKPKPLAVLLLLC